jgi:3'-phosphoadenosine 5'-phosphosulfate sulfotransferase (PAPS reductase)/FAD synthetase
VVDGALRREAYASDPFGTTEGVVPLDMLSRMGKRVRVFALDTGFLSKKAVEFRQRVQQPYELPLEVFHPRLTVDEQAHRYGERLYERGLRTCAARCARQSRRSGRSPGMRSG